MPILGQSIGGKLTSQIKARQGKHGATIRDKETLGLLNSNTAWVKLRSGVNTVSKQTSLNGLKAIGSTPSGNSSLAKSLILTGGVLNGSTQRAGIGTTSTTGGAKAYHNSPSTGFRPMPGITGVSSKSKGTFGTLREAEVSFKVWSKEDFDNIERLYFRVGFSCLLEYGHSVYLTNGGSIETFTNAKTVRNSTWFGSKSPKSIDREIDQLRESTDGNYEGIFGFISNFNWKLNNDGSYDCSVTIISKGIIMEGLAEGKTSDGLSAEEREALAEKQAESNREENKSIYHAVLKGIEAQKGVEGFFRDLLSSSGCTGLGNQLQNHKAFGLDVSIGRFTNFILKLLNDNIFMVYIPLRALLDICNKFNIMKGPDGEPICGFNINNNEKFSTFPGHFTVDPLVALPPRVPSGEFSFAQISREGLHSKFTQSDNILDIMLTSQFIKSKMEDLQQSAQEPGTGIFDFIKNILTDINFAFGNIPTLELMYRDLNGGEYFVVDRGMPQATSSPGRIDLSGLTTTVTNIDVNSKLSSQMKSMVSIAAQGNTGNYKDNLDSILKFNAGVVDRNYLSKHQNSGTKQADPNVEPFRKRFEEAWENFNDKDVIDPEKFNEMRTEAIAQLTRDYKRGNANKLSAGIPVPIELSITLKGISLFKIGEVFAVNTAIMPAKYKDYGFIITAVDHTIENGQWMTNVGTKMYTIS